MNVLMDLLFIDLHVIYGYKGAKQKGTHFLVLIDSYALPHLLSPVSTKTQTAALFFG